MSTVGLRRYIIGEDLVALRKRIGWSQQAVAEYLGLRHESQLNQIESGRRWISYAEEVLLKQLEEAFERGELKCDNAQPLRGTHNSTAAT
jgi:transcriptional regulator with XRE-family HTH domain